MVGLILFKVFLIVFIVLILCSDIRLNLKLDSLYFLVKNIVEFIMNLCIILCFEVVLLFVLELFWNLLLVFNLWK